VPKKIRPKRIYIKSIPDNPSDGVTQGSADPADGVTQVKADQMFFCRRRDRRQKASVRSVSFFTYF
jgi:hypothetical protein